MTPKLFAQFDSAGKIRSMISYVDAPQGVSLGLTPAPGLQVAELDAAAMGVTAPTVAQLQKLAAAHTISDPIIKRTLVKKP